LTETHKITINLLKELHLIAAKPAVVEASGG